MQVPIIFLALIVATASATGNASITFPQGSDPERAIVQDMKNEAEESPLREIAHHVANLGLKTLRDLLSGDSNVIISPFNLFSCLGILHLGAAGETKDEIRRILGPAKENHTVSDIVEGKDGVSYASALFLDHWYTPRKEFVDTALTDYQASVLNVNTSNAEETKNYINSWVSNHTNGTIRDLLQGRLDSDTKMVVVSALLFKGKWLHPFPTAATALGNFEVEEGVTMEVPMMYLYCSVPRVRSPHFDAISLPYMDDHGMRMHLILPKTHGVPALKQLLSHLNANSLRKFQREQTHEEILIAVPKIKIEGRFSLTNALKKQGVVSMFNPTKANFTNFVNNSQQGGERLFVSQVLHSIHFEMDEEGTVASAATAAILTKSRKFVFRANRPFIFVITDESDIILFMGAVLRPE